MNHYQKEKFSFQILINRRFVLFFPETFPNFVIPCGISSVGRALASQAEGREFEPRIPLTARKPLAILRGAFFIGPV